MGNNMVSCDLRRQLVYSYHLITKFLCHLWEATQANVSSHLIMKRKNRQNVLEKQTALITPSQCSLRIWKKALCRQVLYIKKQPVLKIKKKIRMNALMPACPIESGKQCVVKVEGKSCKEQTCQENKQYDYCLQSTIYMLKFQNYIPLTRIYPYHSSTVGVQVKTAPRHRDLTCPTSNGDIHQPPKITLSSFKPRPVIHVEIVFLISLTQVFSETKESTGVFSFKSNRSCVLGR